MFGKRVVLAIALLAALRLAPQPASVVAAGPVVQGIYDFAPITAGDYQRRLADIADAGFKVVLNYSVLAGFDPSGFGTLQDIIDYADAAQAKGLQVIWSLKDEQWRDGTDRVVSFGVLARHLRANTSEEVVSKLIAVLKGHAATWGYYVADEAEDDEASRVEALVEIIRSVDRDHPTLTIHTSNQFRFGKMQAFAAAANWMGIDDYPVGRTCEPWEKALANHSQRIREAFAWVKGQNKPFVVVLQAHDFNLYPDLDQQWIQCPRWPSEGEMRDMRQAALTQSQPSLILWYSYFDVIKHPDHTVQWQALIRAAFPPGG